jgi:hypothetical protein
MLLLLILGKWNLRCFVGLQMCDVVWGVIQNIPDLCPYSGSLNLGEPNFEPHAAVSMECPVQDRSHISWRWRTHRETHKLHNYWNCCIELNSSSARTDVRSGTALPAELAVRWMWTSAAGYITLLQLANGRTGDVRVTSCCRAFVLTLVGLVVLGKVFNSGVIACLWENTPLVGNVALFAVCENIWLTYNIYICIQLDFTLFCYFI